MSRQPQKLSVDQVIEAMEQLTPAEKRQIQRRLPQILGKRESAHRRGEQMERPIPRGKDAETTTYNFSKVRKLLSKVKGNLSDDVVDDRNERGA